MHGLRRILCCGIALAGTTVSPPLAAAEPVVHRVLIQQFTFVPGRLEIRAGDRVEWVNRDIAPHTATADDPAWSSGNLTRGQSVQIDFLDAGRVVYFCSHHPHMRGEIIVSGE